MGSERAVNASAAKSDETHEFPYIVNGVKPPTWSQKRWDGYLREKGAQCVDCGRLTTKKAFFFGEWAEDGTEEQVSLCPRCEKVGLGLDPDGDHMGCAWCEAYGEGHHG